MAVDNSNPLSGNREYPAPSKACCAGFAGRLFESGNQIAVPVAKRKIERKYRAFGDDFGAKEIAAVDDVPPLRIGGQLRPLSCTPNVTGRKARRNWKRHAAARARAAVWPGTVRSAVGLESTW